MRGKFTGNFPYWQNGRLELTCQAFLKDVEEEHGKSGFSKAKILAENLDGPALDWFLSLEGNLTDWSFLKEKLLAEFKTQMSVKDKVEIRQSLRQNEEESIEEYLERCTNAQFAITDDDEVNEAIFERDVLLNFLLGMKRELQAKVIICNQSTLSGFLQEALAVAKALDSEGIKPDIKLENLAEESNGKWAVTIGKVKPRQKRKSSKICFKDLEDVDQDPDSPPRKRRSSKLTHKKEELDPDFHVEDASVVISRKRSSKIADKKEVLEEVLDDPDFLMEDPPEETEELQPVIADVIYCKVCGKYEKEEKKMDLHMMVKHRRNQEEFECDICNTVLKSEASLKKHVQFTCLGERPVTCPICEKPFIDNKTVKIHVRSVHMKERPHLCAECGRGFCSASSLKTHRLNVHEHLKNYPCTKCDKVFGNQGGLYTHNQRHHERYNYCCDLCGKQFCRPFELKRHKASKHGIGSKPHACTQCDKAFFEPKELQTHVSVAHEGARPCTCPECPETFTRKSAMKRHIKRKHPAVLHLYVKKKNAPSTEDFLEEQS